MKKPHIYYLLLILAVAAFLRFYQITSLPPGLYPDEAVNGINTLQVIKEGAIKVFYPENNGREGLFINIQSASVWLFGTEPWALRIVSGAFGILTVLGLYLLCRELLKKLSNKTLHLSLIPLLSALFIATNFWHINFSRIGFRAITAPFWGVWGFYLILLSFRKLRESTYEKTSDYSLVASRYLLPTLGGLVFGLGFHSYISYRVMPALLLFVFIYQFFVAKKEAKNNKALKQFFISMAIISVTGILAALPLLIHFYSVPEDLFGRTGEISIFKSATPVADLIGNIIKTAGMFNVAGDFNQRHNLAGSPELFWPVGIFFLVGLYYALKTIVLTIWRYFRKSTLQNFAKQNLGGQDFFVACFLIIWLKITLLPVVISDEGIPHALRSILVIPPVFILCGIGAVISYSFLKRCLAKIVINPDSAMRAAAWGFLVALTLTAYNTYFVTWAKDPRTPGAFDKDYTDMAHQLKSLLQDTKKYVVIPPGNMAIDVIQFITDTYEPIDQKQKNFLYLTPEEFVKIKMDNRDFVAKVK